MADGTTVLPVLRAMQYAITTGGDGRSDGRYVMHVQVMLYRDTDHVISFQGILQPYSVVCLPPHVAIDEDEYQVAARPVIIYSPGSDEGCHEGEEVLEDEMQHAWSAAAAILPGLDKVLVSHRKRPADPPNIELDGEAEGSWFVRSLAEFEHLGVAPRKPPRHRRQPISKAHNNLWPPLPPQTDAAGEEEDKREEGCNDTFSLVTLSFVAVLAVRNLLPSDVRVAFVLEGHDAPLPCHVVASGQLLPVHHFGLSGKVSVGLAMPGLEEASEFVPVFSPDGSTPENHVTVYDEHGLLLRLSLAHVQKAHQVFELHICAPYWIMNRTTFPVELGQKWTASNVTLVGGQASLETLGPRSPDKSLAGAAEGEAVGRSRAIADGGASVRQILQGSVPPIPFSFHWKVDVGGSKATVRLGPPYSRYSGRDGMKVACEWSSAFSLDSLSADRPLTLLADGFSVDIVASVSMGPGALRQTRIVSLLPRYVVYNNLARAIQVCQVGAEEASTLRLDAGEMQVIRWHDESFHRRVRVRLLTDGCTGLEEEDEWEWSGPVSVDALGYRPLKLRRTKGLQHPYLPSTNLLLHAAMQGPVTFVNVHPEGENGALEVCNQSRLVIACFRQAHVSRNLEEQASPTSAAPYCWDFPEAEPILQMRFVIDGHEVAAREYNMDRLGAFPPLAWSRPPSPLTVVGESRKDSNMQGVLMVSIIARGPTKILLVQDLQASPIPHTVTNLPAAYRPTGARGTQTSAAKSVRDIPPVVTSTCHTVNLAGLGISIIDGRPEELVYISVLGIRGKAVMSGGDYICLLSRLYLPVCTFSVPVP